MQKEQNIEELGNDGADGQSESECDQFHSLDEDIERMGT